MLVYTSFMSKKLTTKQLAQEVNLTYVRINQMIQEGEIKAEKVGRDYLIDAKYIEVIKSRPEKRGRKKKAMEVKP